MTTRVRLSPDTRREQLLDLGVRLLSTRSLEELSIDVFAEEAGVSRGLLYHYFTSKRGFHRAVVRRATDAMLAVTSPDPELPPLERLTVGLDAYVGYVRDNYQPFLSLVRGAAGGDADLREIYGDARAALTGRILDAVGELGLADTPRLRLLTHGWAAMVEETVIAWVPEQQVDQDELVRLLADALPALLREDRGARAGPVHEIT